MISHGQVEAGTRSDSSTWTQCRGPLSFPEQDMNAAVHEPMSATHFGLLNQNVSMMPSAGKASRAARIK